MGETLKEDEIGLSSIATGAPSWAEVARRPGKKKFDPPEIYWATEAPTCSAEGYRVVWMRSSAKRADDAAARVDRIESARARLSELHESLSSPRCQLKRRAAVEAAAAAILKESGTAWWVRVEVPANPGAGKDTSALVGEEVTVVICLALDG